MSLANRITILRICLVPFFMIFMFNDNFFTRIFALLIFIVAGLSDIYDGWIARKYGEVTNFGKFMDPLADKLIVSCALISFVQLQELLIPAWMVIIIISREFIITGLRTLAASKGKVIGALLAGKVKNTVQMTVIILILLILAINAKVQKPDAIWQAISRQVPYWLILITTMLTLISGINYIFKNKEIFHEETN